MSQEIIQKKESPLIKTIIKTQAQKNNFKNINYVKRISGTTLVAPDSSGNISVPFTYSDNFFFSIPYNYSVQLARASMVLAYSAFNANDPKNGSENLEEYLSKLGFYDFMSNEDYHSLPSTDSFGVGIAQKTIKVSGIDYTIIALGLRGGNYTNEWSGNFRVGKEGDHEGFTIGVNKVLDFLTKYIKITNIKGNIKLWSAGFSRGAAVNNMFGAKIDDLVSSNQALSPNVKLTLNDIFVYCFETPQGSLSSNTQKVLYKNIHNTLNHHDMVTRMGPTAMGFKRFGNDYYIPCKDFYDKKSYDKLYAQVLVNYKKIDSGQMYKNILHLNDKFTYINFDPRLPKENCTEFIDRVMDTLSDIAGYRDGMYGIQDEMSNFIVMFKASQKTFTGENFFLDFISFMKTDADDIMAMIFSNKETKIEERLEKHAEKALKESGVLVYDHKKVHNFISIFTDFELEFAKKYPSDAVNVIYNLINTIIPHDPTLEIAWLNAIPIPTNEPKYF